MVVKVQVSSYKKVKTCKKLQINESMGAQNEHRKSTFISFLPQYLNTRNSTYTPLPRTSQTIQHIRGSGNIDFKLLLYVYMILSSHKIRIYMLYYNLKNIIQILGLHVIVYQNDLLNFCKHLYLKKKGTTILKSQTSMSLQATNYTM